MKHMFRWLNALLFPPVCRGCGERQSIFAPRLPGVLCPSCIQRWQEEKAKVCAACNNVHAQCRCVPNNVSESGGDDLLHLTAYRSHHNTVTAALVLRCKDNNDREVFRFLASELAVCVKDAKISLPHDAVVTFVPRRRAAVQAKGHDHAKQLATALAHELNLPFDTLLRRRILTRQQKELDAVAREKNAAHSFEAVDESRIKGRTVLLIDDVCTTGASLAACTALLMAAQAERVICAVVAQTEQEK